MEAVIIRVKFIEPMGYEMSEELIEGYGKIILQFEIDSTCPRWGTYEEKIKEVQSSKAVKDSQKKVEKVIESILKESGMSRKEFEEVKGITKEMKASGQFEILTPTPIAIVAPEVTVAQTSMQAPSVPYATVAQQQPQRKGKEVEKKPTQRKSTRVEEEKHVSQKKRSKQTTSGPRKKRKTLKISSSFESDEEIGDILVQQATQEVKTPIGRKAWKPKVENLNVQIINDNNFVQLNKYYSMYNNMDRRQLENAVVRNMILKDKIFYMIKGQILEDLYNTLMNRKR